MKKPSEKSATTRFILSLPRDLVGRLDQLAAEMGLSRAEVCRRALGGMVEDRARFKERTKALQSLQFLRRQFEADKRWQPTEAIREARER
jgi:metal-responsive CopG/Arc/MetJ family transcriptional regulator